MHNLEWKQVCTTRRSIYYRKYILEITQPSQYRYTQLQYRFAVISEAPQYNGHMTNNNTTNNLVMALNKS